MIPNRKLLCSNWRTGQFFGGFGMRHDSVVEFGASGLTFCVWYAIIGVDQTACETAGWATVG